MLIHNGDVFQRRVGVLLYTFIVGFVAGTKIGGMVVYQNEYDQRSLNFTLHERPLLNLWTRLS